MWLIRDANNTQLIAVATASGTYTVSQLRDDMGSKDTPSAAVEEELRRVSI
jgi:hypothetical protein